MESRTQGSRPRPRTQKKSEAKAKDSPSEDRPSQGQECSRPRPRTEDTSTSALQKKKKVFKNFFLAFSSKNRLLKFFFRRSTKTQQFKKKCCFRAEDRAIFEDLRPRGQGQELDLQGQSQGLQNVSSRTSSRTPPLVVVEMKSARNVQYLASAAVR